MEGQFTGQLSGSARDDERRDAPVALPKTTASLRLLSFESNQPHAAIVRQCAESGVSSRDERRGAGLPTPSVAPGETKGHDGDADDAHVWRRTAQTDVLRQGPGNDGLHGDGVRAQRQQIPAAHHADARQGECLRHEL